MASEQVLSGEGEAPRARGEGDQRSIGQSGGHGLENQVTCRGMVLLLLFGLARWIGSREGMASSHGSFAEDLVRKRQRPHRRVLSVDVYGRVVDFRVGTCFGSRLSAIGSRFKIQDSRFKTQDSRVQRKASIGGRRVLVSHMRGFGFFMDYYYYCLSME